MFLVLGVVSILAVAAPPSAEARTCDGFKFEHEFYAVGSEGLSCKLADRWAERYVRSGTKPKGWKCSQGGCEDRSSGDFFIWFRPFDRLAPRAGGCDTVQSRGGYDLVFFKSDMKCSTAKSYAKKLMRDGSFDAPGFECQRSDPDSGGCTHERKKNKFFIFYPEH